MNVVLKITVLVMACSLISEVYCEEAAAADTLECYDCIGETCSNVIECASRTCYKGVGTNGSEPFAVWSCLMDTSTPDCVAEAQAKAEGKSGDGSSSEEFRDEGGDEAKITIDKCLTCTESKCNGVDTIIMSRFILWTALAAILALGGQF